MVGWHQTFNIYEFKQTLGENDWCAVVYSVAKRQTGTTKLLN